MSSLRERLCLYRLHRNKKTKPVALGLGVLAELSCMVVPEVCGEEREREKENYDLISYLCMLSFSEKGVHLLS